METETFDPTRVTYTDGEGASHGALEFLLTDRQTGESTGHLACFSRYGSTARDCAPVAVALAIIYADSSGDPISADGLDGAMSLVVNESDDVARLIVDHGPACGIDPTTLLDEETIADALHAIADEWSGVDSLAEHIDPDDVELLEWAGVPERPDDR